MFIETHSVPQHRLRINRYNDQTNCTESLINDIPSIYPEFGVFHDLVAIDTQNIGGGDIIKLHLVR